MTPASPDQVHSGPRALLCRPVLPAVQVSDELDALEEALDACAALREGGGERAFERAPAVSGWSAAQHLYHVALATDLAFRNVRALVRGSGPMIVQEGEPNALAVRVLTEGSYPRGASQAPRTVQPGNDVDPEFLSEEMRRNREGLAELRALAEAIPRAADGVPHKDLGTLSAAHWLRFARLHLEHHLAIARDVAAALAP